MPHKIPLLNLQEQYRQIGEKLEQSVINVLRSGNYILGQHVCQLESDVAKLSGCKHGIGVANGTDALFLALWALDIGPGDEVITTPFTFAATAEAIILLGATPVFVDINETSFNIDPKQIEKAITSKTKAILPVHLYGQPSDMDPIMEIANRHQLKVVEDNAQAIGASYKGRPTGSFGNAACISFYPTKNLGAAGDAGMIVTNDDKLAERIRTIRTHGMKKRYHHDELGVNSRLDEIQAVTLLTKLPYLATWNQQRRELAKLYNDQLADCKQLLTPKEVFVSKDNQCAHVWHQYTIRVPNRSNSNSTLARDLVAQELDKHGIGSMCYYPIPLHQQRAFSYLGNKTGDFPITERVANEVLSLPMYPELTPSQVKEVASVLKEILNPKKNAPINLGIPQSAAIRS